MLSLDQILPASGIIQSVLSGGGDAQGAMLSQLLQSMIAPSAGSATGQSSGNNIYQRIIEKIRNFQPEPGRVPGSGALPPDQAPHQGGGGGGGGGFSAPQLPPMPTLPPINPGGLGGGGGGYNAPINPYTPGGSFGSFLGGGGSPSQSLAAQTMAQFFARPANQNQSLYPPLNPLPEGLKYR